MAYGQVNTPGVSKREFDEHTHPAGDITGTLLVANGKTAKSILISCGARMAPFDIAEVRHMMEGDDLELDLIGDRKTALFCVVSDTDTTFNFIPAMVYTQMFNVLCDRALENGGALKTHVTCLLDEFANQKIPNFQHLISVIRSREISAHIVVQTQSQLKALYQGLMKKMHHYLKPIKGVFE